MRNPKDWQNKSVVSGAEDLNWSQKSNPKAQRPQKPSDVTVRSQVWSPGQVPMGGFRSVICFEQGGDSYNSKISSTTKPEKKNRII
jgi:hypothetical protein